MRKYPVLITLSFLVQIASGQSKYFIYFSDKTGVEFDPYSYFDQKAIDRRTREGLSLYDSTDFPVNDSYVSSVKKLCDSARIVSRWMNGMSVFATDEQIREIQLLPFVKEIEMLQNYDAEILSYGDTTDESLDLDNSEINLLKFQTYRHQADAFRQNNLTGQGIRIAIFDVGFPNVDTHPAFQYIRDHHHIIATYNFVKNEDFVYYSMSHGTSVLSCIAGWYDTIPIGMATDAEFLLAKTELRHTEFASEEDNWLAAAEWADKNGADIISSSLGYGKERYYQNEMNGKKSLVSRAAEMASSKGILVVNAAGNEATNVWETIVTPGDAEDVLTVGGINAYTDMHINFSSFGPTSDGRLKPNVCSLGDVICATKKGFGNLQGTSFATPLLSGFAACAWQSSRELTRAQLFDKIERSGHLYPYYDYAHGYGVPQATYFTSAVVVAKDTTFTATVKDDRIEIEFRTKHIPNPGKQKNFYYEFIDDQGSIIWFGVMATYPAESETPAIEHVDVPFSVLESFINYSFRAHFEGYTATIPLKISDQ